MEDEREGLPSGSNQWLFNCLGAGELIRQFPKLGNDKTKDSTTGDRRHWLIETRSTDFNDTEEEYVVTRALQLRDEAIAVVWDSEKGLKYRKEFREWLLDNNFKKAISCKYDELVIGDCVGLIIDYKTLNNSHGSANENTQLLTNSIIVEANYDFEEIWVALIQPNLGSDMQLTMCKYTRAQLVKAKARLLKWLEKYSQDGHDRTPGNHCKWCPVRTRCAENLGDRFDIISQSTELVEVVTDDYMEKVDLAYKMIKDLKDNARAKALEQLQKDPESLKGYKINKGKTTTTVDTISAKLVQILGGATFARACKLSLPKLAKAYKDATCSDKPLSEVRKELEELLSDCITKTEGEETIGKR